MKQWQKIAIVFLLLAFAIASLLSRRSPAPTSPPAPITASIAAPIAATSSTGTPPPPALTQPSAPPVTIPPIPPPPPAYRLPLVTAPSQSQTSAPLSAPPGNSTPTDSPAGLEPRIAEAAVRNAVQKYGSTFGGNPVGTNAEITAALNGDNPRHARFLEGIPGQQIDSNGNLVDSWGTPYFFHQLSASDMEVRSAGPDRIMWTSDDIVIK